MKILTMIALSLMFVVGCSVKEGDLVKIANVPDPVFEGEATTELFIMEDSPIAGVTPTTVQNIDKTPVEYFIESDPICSMNYTGGGYITSPKFVMGSDTVKYIQIVNPAYNTGINKKMVDATLSLMMGAGGSYTVTVTNTHGEIQELYLKSAMGPVTPTDTVSVGKAGVYGLVFGFLATPEDGSAFEVAIKETKKPPFYATSRKITNVKDRRGRVLYRIEDVIGYQGAHISLSILPANVK